MGDWAGAATLVALRSGCGTAEAAQASQVVELRDYRNFGGVRLPTRRIFLGPLGHPQMEMVISRMDVGQRLPKAQFQPQRD